MKRIGQFILDWVWQLPQHIVGLLLILFLGAKKQGVQKEPNGDVVWYWDYERGGWFSNFISGASLGRYILLPKPASNTTIFHEHGHSKQSVILGPLYLLIVGIYSAVFCNLWDRFFHKGWNTYDRLYWYYKTRLTEIWADRLGGVDRIAALRKIDRPDYARFPEV